MHRNDPLGQPVSGNAKLPGHGQPPEAAGHWCQQPLVNASKPPGEWQTYDIVFESSRWNEQGELVKKACISVLHNGVVVQNHYELTGCTDRSEEHTSELQS